MADVTLTTRLQAAAQTPGAGIRLLDERRGERLLPFAEVLERACRAAGTLQQAGVQAGDHVALIIPTGVEFLDAFFGAMVLGAVPVPLYPPIRLGRLEEYYERTAAMASAVRAAAIVAPTAVRSLLGQVVARYRPPCGVVAAESLTRGAAVEPAPRHTDDLALIQYSSGTTVEPKPVSLTHRHVLSNLDALLSSVAPNTKDQVGVSWLPLYHDMGLIGFLLGTVCRAGLCVLIPPEQFLARPRLWLQAMSRYKATITAAPSFAYAYCVERVTDADMQGCDLSSLEFALNGAEMVLPNVLRAFTTRFAPWGLKPTALTPVYGLAECTLGVTVSGLGQTWTSRHLNRQALLGGHAEPGEDLEIVCVGRALTQVHIEIRSEGEVLPEQRVGHIWVQGPSLPSHRVFRPESQLVDGWLDTGDLGFLWDGELYITGRAKDVIILRGENHSPHEIERVVDRVPGIRTGCVAAVGQRESDGERLLVLAEVREVRPGLEDECRRAVMSAVGIGAEVRLLEPGTLPRTSSGKIRRQEALRRFESGTLLAPARVTPMLLGKAWIDNLMGYRKRP